MSDFFENNGGILIFIETIEVKWQPKHSSIDNIVKTAVDWFNQ